MFGLWFVNENFEIDPVILNNPIKTAIWKYVFQVFAIFL